VGFGDGVTVFEGKRGCASEDEARRCGAHWAIRKTASSVTARDNWWGGQEGPCGPDTEIFVDRTGEPCEKGAELCGGDIRWRAVRPRSAKQRVNCRTNGQGNRSRNCRARTSIRHRGLERTLASLNGVESVYETRQFRPILGGFELSGLPRSGSGRMREAQGEPTLLADTHRAIEIHHRRRWA